MRHLIGDEAAANLKRGDARAIVLPTLRPDEIEQIREDIPGLPQERPEAISLSGLNFAAAVNFQDFYFPVSVDFSISRFGGNARFTGSTFAEEAHFKESRFAGIASFTGSTFEEEADFTGSRFAGIASFTGSTFEEEADFTGSRFAINARFTRIRFARNADFTGSRFGGNAIFTRSRFAGNADFTGSRFAGLADFKKSIFRGDAIFTGRTFTGDADFSNSKYEGKTSFQNVTFTRAPLFFETTLHEDTDWTRIKWPDKPEDKEDATEYVRRYERLALVMNTLKQPDNEHLFFRLSMQAKEVRDGKGISTSLSRFYGLFRYGWGLECALKLWVFHILFGAGCLSVMDLFQRSPPFPDLAEICRKIFMMLAISFSNSHPFLGLHRGPAKSAYASFNKLSGFDIVWGTQIVSGSLLLFFLLLTIRNRFRLR